jgi:hypothetical protein
MHILNKIFNYTPQQQDGAHPAKVKDLRHQSQDESHAAIQLGYPSS